MSASKRRSARRKPSAVPSAAGRGTHLKSPAEIDAMAVSGAALAEVMELLGAEVREGVSTLELDQIAEELIRARGAIPTFKGYHDFPGSICPSVNSEVVHAIPGPYRLEPGDIISIDVGLTLNTWVADTARTFTVGSITTQAARLLSVTEAALYRGIDQARPGNHVGDIGHAVQTEVEAAGFSVVRSLVGHGVGHSMHEEPQVPNFGSPGVGVELVEGMVIAIEPMVNAGTHDVVMDSDGWTICSADGSLSAHFEHTVAVTSAGPRILTTRPATEAHAATG
jgi:methionyl aminopeptidase